MTISEDERAEQCCDIRNPGTWPRAGSQKSPQWPLAWLCRGLSGVNADVLRSDKRQLLLRGLDLKSRRVAETYVYTLNRPPSQASAKMEGSNPGAEAPKACSVQTLGGFTFLSPGSSHLLSGKKPFVSGALKGS